MKFLTHIVTALAAATLTSTSVVKSPTMASQEGNFELLILHNNDMHARFEQTSQLSGTCTVADREAGKCYGGFPRVAYVVKEARRAAASGEGPPVLYLNAGDTYTGTAWFTIYKWKIAAEFINALQPDAVALGNNEMERGSSDLSPFVDGLQVPVIATNIIVKGQPNKLQKSLIFDLKGTRIGVVGYLTPDSQILDDSGDIEYIEEVVALQEEVSKLKTHNISIVIALGHADFSKNIEVAKEVEGIDLVIAGHKNYFMWNGASAKAQDVDEVIEICQSSGKIVPVVQSYAYSKYLGKLLLQFDANGELTSYTNQPVLLDKSVSEDAKSRLLLNNLSKDMARNDEVVGQTAVVLDGDSCRTEECNLGNLITDAIVYHYAVRFEGERWTDAPVAVIPGAYIATSIAPTNRPADITLANLLTALPIESHLVAVTMNGAILLEVLEHAISNYDSINPTGQLLQFSGIRIVYDLNRENGSRVKSAVVRCWACTVPEFYSIDDWRDYKILMPISMANGDLGYSMLVGLPRESLTYDEITCVSEYISMRSPVYPEVAERIDILNIEDEVTPPTTATTDTTTTEAIVTTEETTTTEPTTTTVDTTTTEVIVTETTTTESTEATTPDPGSAVAISSSITIFILTIIIFILM